MQGIYMISNKLNGKCYVGQSVDIEHRWADHRYRISAGDEKEYKYPLYRAFRKYGLENFSFSVLEEVENLDDLTNKELYWYYKLNPEYNQIKPEYNCGSVVLRKEVCKINRKTNDIEEIYVSIREAARQNNVDQSGIVKVCKGKQRIAGGYKWKYKDLVEGMGTSSKLQGRLIKNHMEVIRCQIKD